MDPLARMGSSVAMAPPTERALLEDLARLVVTPDDQPTNCASSVTHASPSCHARRSLAQPVRGTPRIYHRGRRAKLAHREPELREETRGRGEDAEIFWVQRCAPGAPMALAIVVRRASPDLPR